MLILTCSATDKTLTIGPDVISSDLRSVELRVDYSTRQPHSIEPEALPRIATSTNLIAELRVCRKVRRASPVLLPRLRREFGTVGGWKVRVNVIPKALDGASSRVPGATGIRLTEPAGESHQDSKPPPVGSIETMVGYD